MKKKILLTIIAGLIVIGGVAALSAFEAHIINVTAKIENALSVSPLKIEFGTVFPQEGLTKEFEISVSNSFQEQNRVNSVGYQILEKEKPLPGGGGNYPSLCEFLTEKIDGGIYQPGEAVIVDSAEKDKVAVDLIPPCFEGQCEQGYEGPVLSTELEGETFGCDLWVEVTDISQAAAIWHFDEGTGSTAYDSSGNDNDGAINGANWVAGKYNTGLSFDGNDNVVINDSPSLRPALVRLEAWVKKPGSPGTYKYIAGKYYSGGYASYAFYTGSSGGLRFYIGHSGGFVLSPDAGTGVWDGNWHHIVGTYDGSKVRLYVDGSEVGTGTPTTVNIAYNANKFYIGSYGSGFYFNSVIDEIRVLDIANTF